MDEEQGLTRDAILGGRLELVQPRRGHRIGSDAVLLAAAAGDADGLAVADLGCGVGTIGLSVARAAPAASVTLVDNDPAILALAARNAELNGLGGRTTIVAADILAPSRQRLAAGLANDAFDLVLSNPPFLKAGAARSSPLANRSRAHDMPEGGLETWVAHALALLKPRGRLILIHRADALPAILAAIGARAGGIRVLPIHPVSGREAARVVVGAEKGSRAPFALRPPLVLNGPDGRFTPEAEALHRGEARLTLWP